MDLAHDYLQYLQEHPSVAAIAAAYVGIGRRTRPRVDPAGEALIQRVAQPRPARKADLPVYVQDWLMQLPTDPTRAA